MNVENEAALDAGNEEGREKLTDDTERLSEAIPKVNGKPLAPAGYGHIYDEDGNRDTVPVTMPPSFTPEEKERLDVIGPVIEWCHGSKARLAALQYLGGLDRRTVAEIAKTHKISASIVHREIGKLRAFIGALRP